MEDQYEGDAVLIQAAQDDPASFGTLFERHFGTIYRFCGRRVGQDLAEDLAGETFRRAFEARTTYDLDHPNALPWLYAIARHLVQDSIRARAAEDRAYARLRAFGAVSLPNDEESAVRAVEARANLRQLARLLLTETEDDVEALFLNVWDGLTYAEIATALEVPVGTVRSRLSRLRRRLKSALEGPYAENTHLRAQGGSSGPTS